MAVSAPCPQEFLVADAGVGKVQSPVVSAEPLSLAFPVPEKKVGRRGGLSRAVGRDIHPYGVAWLLTIDREVGRLLAGPHLVFRIFNIPAEKAVLLFPFHAFW